MPRYKIEQLRISTDFGENALKNKIARTLGVHPVDILNVKLLSKSIDARKKPPVNVIGAEVLLKNPPVNALGIKNLKLIEESRNPEKADESGVGFGFSASKKLIRPAVVGFGPAGLCAAYILAKNGARPIIFERGEPISLRQKKADLFWNDGILDENSNVLFGEGAGYAGGIVSSAIDGIKCAKTLLGKYS